MAGKLFRMHFWRLEYENGQRRTWHCRGCDGRVILNEANRAEVVTWGVPPTMLELTINSIDRSCPRTAKPTESYLTLVVAGPGKPLSRMENPYCTLQMATLRRAPGVVLCQNAKCTLSGGYSHVGPCEPCGCPLEHAIDECPVQSAPKR